LYSIHNFNIFAGIMAEENKDTKIEIMPNSGVVSIKVSGAFLTRIQSVLVYLLNDMPTERIKEAAERIQKQEHTEPWEFHYETLAVLINDIERSAREEGITETKTIAELEAEEAAQSTTEESSEPSSED
jgi:hypothetical protein